METRRPNGKRARGFTLVEVLVASLIFAIGVPAAIGMQYAALGGYANSRDVSRASDVGERVIYLLRAESQQWTGGADSQYLPSSEVYTAYDTGNTFHFNTFSSGGMLQNISWDWTPVFTSPVDVRFSDAGARLYCAYYRGEHVRPSTGGSARNTGIYRVQVAVVYPAPNGGFPNASRGDVGDCDSTDITDNLEPQRWDFVGATPLEQQGFRAVYQGTQIVLRNFVTEHRAVQSSS